MTEKINSRGAVPSGLQRLRGARGLLAAVLVVLASACWLVPGASAQASMVEENALSGLSAMTQASAYDAPRGLIHFGLTNTSSFEYVTLNSTSWELVEYKEVDNSEAVTALWVDGDDLFIASDQGNNAVSFVTRFNVATQLPKKVLLPFGLRPRNMYITGGRLYLGCQGTTGLGHYIRMTANFDTSDIPGTFEEIPDIKAPPNKVDFDTASNFLYYTIDEARSFARISTDTWDVVTHYEEYIGIFSCINVEPGAFLYLTTVLSDSASIVFQLDITDPELGLETLLFLTEATYASSLDTDYNYLYFATFPVGKVHKVLTTDMTLYDTVSTSTLGWTSAAFDPVNKVMFLHDSVSNATKFSVENCASQLSCGPCAALDDYCGWCYSDDACALADQCAEAATFYPASCPAVTDISPLSGSIAGGTALTVTGTDFRNDSRIDCDFGVAGVVEAIFDSPTQIRCYSPPIGAEGNVDVTLVFDGQPYAGPAFNFLFYDCSLPTTCSTCVDVLRPECAWCVLTSNCSTTASCPVTNIDDAAECPVINSRSPESGALEGGYELTIFGAQADTWASVPLTCVFNGAVSVPATGSGFSIKCVVPNRLTPGSVLVEVYNGAVPYTDSTTTFTYYDCAAVSCDTCHSAARPMCGWCRINNNCTISSVCGPTFADEATECPALTSINPSRGSIEGGTEVLVTGSNFVNPGSVIKCRFGTFDVTPTFLTGTQQYSCVTPAQAGPLVSFSLVHEGNAWAPPTTLPFTYYDCANSGDCDTCLNATTQPECGWCIFDNACTTSLSCANATYDVFTSSCPTLNAVAPTSGPSDGAITPGFLTLTGSEFYDSPDNALACRFGGSTITAATVVTAASVECNLPSFATGATTLELYNTRLNQPYVVGSIPFEFYSCAWDCATCITSQYAACGWCPDDAACTVKSNCSSQTRWRDAQCPAFTAVAPVNGSTAGNTLVVVEGALFLAGLDLDCRFDATPQEGTRQTDTELRCSSPPAGAAGTVAVEVLLNGAPYVTDTRSYDYYDCSLQTSCETCYHPDRKECGWCLQESRCLAEAQCTDVVDWFDSTASCAAVLSASPDRGPIEGGTTVTVVGSQFRDVGLQCRFDGTDKVLAVVVNETHLTCVAPLASGGGGSVALEVLNSDDTLYSSDSTTFIYYNCGLETACASCFDADARPECGWCRGEGACTIASECTPIGTFDATCPTLVGISPSSGAIDGGTLVNVTGTLFTPSINIQCDFDVGASTNATFVSSTLLQCYSPPTASPNVETFTLLDTTNAIPFTPGFFDSYIYYNCGESSSCNACTTTSVIKPECGWCVNNQACQISSECGAGVWSSSDCPELYGLFPASGAVDGGTVIEISGDFIDGVAYECVVGPSTAPAVFNNVTGNITCVAPFQGADGPQQLTVEYQGTSVAFADNFLTFNYYDCADGTDCGSCITADRPECGFCLGNSLCTINSNCAALDWSPQVCPALDAFLPATGGAIDGGTNVTVVGQAFTDVIPLACRFDMTGGPFFQPATFVDDNTLKCVSPVAIAAEVANLDIWKADMSGDYAPASPSRPFTFYNCSAGYVSPSCGTCIQLTKPECGHCDTTSCTIEQACSAGVWAGECASIQGIVPDRGALDGGTVVDIAVDTIFQDGPNYTCQFGALSVPANVAVWAGGTNVTCTAPDQLGTLVGDATVAFAIFSNSNPFTQFVDFDYYSCDVNCAACTDPTRSECGWCYADDQCSILSVCSSAPSWEENPANCAALTSVLPTNGATAGNTAVYVTGSNFNFNNGTLSCFFGGVEVDASVVNDTHITCTTPVNAAGPAALVVADRDTDRPFADDTLSFDYYDCGDHINCGVCTAAAAADENECVWCRDTSTCVVSSQCGAGEFTQSTCSEVSTVAPTQGSTEGSTLLTVVGTFFVDVPGLKCRFDKSGLIDQDATFVSDTELQCLSPSAGTDGVATLSIRNGALPYATDTVTYEYYDCGDFTLCSPCSSAATYPECGWCLATATCNTNSSCSTAWADEATGCPSFLAVDPDAGSTGGGTAVNVTGTFFEAGLQCSFGGDTAPATLVSPSLLQCDSTPKAAGPYSVDILTAGGDPFVDTSETFTYYDCSLASDCGTCINAAQPECGWCATTSECTTNCPLAAAFVREVGFCPAIASVLPAAGSRTGGTPVTVSGTSFFHTANLRCEFGTKITAVTVVSNTTLTCTAPSGVAAAPVAFRLRNGGVGEYYSTSVDTFTYYDCPAVTDCATCDSGVRAECGWCLETSTCVVQSNCPNVLYWGQGACPTFDAIAPTEGSTDGGTVILVTGTLFIDESIIECEFNGIRRPATFINETAVQCVTPDSAEGNSVVRLRNGALNYAPETQNFDYYDCNVDCSDCFVTGSECGWCGDSNECTINGVCANFWQQVECPARAGVAPINGAINGGTVVTISGAQFIDSPSLKCKFGNQVVNTSFVSAAEVRCASPPALVGGASLSLQNNGEPFTDDPPQTFTYYDCAAGLDCESCNTTRPECGWCVDDSACVVEASCDAGGLWVQDFGSCPTLSTVLPVNGSIDGGTTVTVSGVGFLAGVAYECDFGGQVTSATYQSPVAVTCVSPPQATPGSKALRVRNADGSAYYTSDTLAFLYYDCDVGCGSCFDNKPECGWCNSQKACTVRDNCAVTANWQRDECPAQFDITPSRGAINGGTSVVVTGLQFFDGLKCRFGDGMTGIVDATIMDQTTAVCVTPPTISATAVNFDLILNGTTVSFTDDNLVFEYYDCLALATCGVCYSELQGDREECGWCLDSNDCRVSADCPGTGAYWTQAGCPALTSITPNSGSLLGGTNVTITGQQFIDNPFFRVQFGPTPVTPTIVSPTLAFAEAPSSVSVATISVSLSQRSELFAPEIKTYSYYDCANDGQVAAVTCDGTPTLRACATIGSECGWCPASTGCTTASICGSTWTRNCPSADFVFPVTGASDGGTFVTVLGEEFVGSLSLQCRFEENDGSSFIDVPATAADPNTLNCITPPHGFGGLKLQVYHSGVQYTPDVLPFQYYECGDKACDLCQQDFFPECGWCQTNNTCSVARKCDATEYLDTECPLLTAANPATGSIQGGTAVTITGAFFNPAIPLQCLFGSTLVNATYVNPGRIECVSPPNAAGSATLGIVNALNGGAYVNAATQYTTFEYYDCAAPDCATCLNPARTECVWCTVDSQCTSSQFCVDPSNRVPLGTPCPAIDTLEPSSGAIEGGTLLTFTAAPGHLHSNLALECHWWATVVESYNVSTVYNATVDQTVLVNVTVGNTTVVQNSTIQVLEERTNVTTFFNSTLASWRAPAVRTTNDVATCVAPPSILLNGGPGVANLTLEHANFSVFGAPFEYTYYDCSAWSSDCDACLAPDRRDCGWCLSSYACTVDCGVNNWANDACPALLFATPPSADLNPVDVVITGTIFNPALTHDCVFDVGGLEVTSPATVTSTTELSCVSPDNSFGVTDNGTLDVRMGGRDYTPDILDFDFYDCSAAPDCATCVDPVAHPSCGWCYASDSCSIASQCATPAFAPTCPAVTDTSAGAFEVMTGAGINITGTAFVEAPNIECVWNSTSAGTVTSAALFLASDGVWWCGAPAELTVSETVTVRLAVDNGDFYAYGSAEVDAFDCVSAAMCDDCTSQYCEFCPYDNMCVRGGTCVRPADYVLSASEEADPPEDWVECPAVYEVTPSEGRTSEPSLVTVSGVSLVHSSSSVTVECQWGNQATEATTLTPTVINCNTPVIDFDDQVGGGGTAGQRRLLQQDYEEGDTVNYPFRVLVNGRPYAAAAAAFSFTVDAEAAIPTDEGSGFPVWVIIAAVAALLLILCAIAIMMAVRNREPELKPPNFVPLIFGAQLRPLIEGPVPRLEVLERLLLEGDMAFVFALCDATAITEADKVCQALIYIFEERDRAIRLVNAFVTREIENSIRTSTLFRSNSFASKLFKHYSKLLGLPYLFQTLAFNVHDVCETYSGENDEQGTIELDPTKQGQGDNAGLNKFTLLLSCQKTLVEITRSVDNLPYNLRSIVAHVAQDVEAKFPDAVHIAIGGFMILRFVCPAITAPEAYGILREPPSVNARRHLVLIAKVLQNLANGVLFGKKERFMEQTNDFIKTNLPEIRAFFDEVATLPQNITPPPHADIPKNVKDNALAFIHNHMLTYMRKVNEEVDHLPSPQAKALKVWITSVLNEVGPGPIQLARAR